MHPSPELLREILSRWGLAFEGTQLHIPIQGSPERCLYRVVVDAGGSRHILEELDSRTLPRKLLVAERISRLAATGLPLAAPRAGLDGRFVQRAGERNWQMTPLTTRLRSNVGTMARMMSATVSPAVSGALPLAVAALRRS